MDRRERLSESHLYFICDARPGGRELGDVLPRALAGGVDIFQLRMKGAPDFELLAVAELARDACAETGALFILNDRPDLVSGIGADGVHVGQDDASIADARQILGAELLVGVSTHAPRQLHDAGNAGADYAGVGPVQETPTKPGRAAVGLEYVRHAALATGLPFEGVAPENVPGAPNSSLPFFAIGGINRDTAAAAVDAGAKRIAVVRAIAEAPDPERAARELRKIVCQGALSGAR